MKAIVTDREIIESLSSLELKAYLLAQGWQSVDKIKDKALILTKAGFSQELILPIRRDLGDFALRLSELIHSLSDIENRSELSIIEDINKSGVDVVRVRMTEGTADGSISLAATSDIFYNTREMLLAAACAAQQPKKVYGSRKSEEALRYLDKVRVGQTEHGSFVLTFLSPVAPKLSSPSTMLFEDMEPEDEPFERQTTKTLMQSLNATKAAAIGALSEGGLELFENAIPLGVSANLCDAITNIVEKAGRAEVSLTWAKTRPQPKQITKNVVSFDRQDAEVIGEAARNFRLFEPIINQNITGWVYKLTQETNGDPKGTIGITAPIDGKLRKLKAILSDNDYQKAVSAHGNKNLLTLEGDLYIRGKNTEILNPRNILVIEQDED